MYDYGHIEDTACNRRLHRSLDVIYENWSGAITKSWRDVMEHDLHHGGEDSLILG